MTGIGLMVGELMGASWSGSLFFTDLNLVHYMSMIFFRGKDGHHGGFNHLNHESLILALA